MNALGLIDFLDNREQAVLVWGIAIVTFAALKGEGVGASFAQVVRALLVPKLLGVYALAGAYCAVVVLGAREVGLWHATALKETIYWFFGSGLPLAGNALVASRFDSRYLKRVLQRAFAFTVILEFAVNLYVFPLLLELFVVPFLLLFIGLQALPPDGANASARRLIDGVLAAMGFVLVIHFVASAINDFHGLWSRENAETLVIAPVLTVAFIPLLYGLALLSGWDLAGARRRIRAASNSPA